MTMFTHNFMPTPLFYGPSLPETVEPGATPAVLHLTVDNNVPSYQILVPRFINGEIRLSRTASRDVSTQVFETHPLYSRLTAATLDSMGQLYTAAARQRDEAFSTATSMAVAVGISNSVRILKVETPPVYQNIWTFLPNRNEQVEWAIREATRLTRQRVGSLKIAVVGGGTVNKFGMTALEAWICFKSDSTGRMKWHMMPGYQFTDVLGKVRQHWNIRALLEFRSSIQARVMRTLYTYNGSVPFQSFASIASTTERTLGSNLDAWRSTPTYTARVAINSNVFNAL